MGGNRYKTIVLPIFLIAIILSVTSCFVFFMNWGGLEGDWKFKSPVETVFLTITKNSVKMIFDEYEPSYYTNTRTFKDWGIRGAVVIDEDSETMDITIEEMFRFFSNWYFTSTPPPAGWRRNTIGGGWYTSATWPWSPPYDFYSNFITNYPGANLGSAGVNIQSSYSLSGDTLNITFDPGPGGINAKYTFKRQ